MKECREKLGTLNISCPEDSSCIICQEILDTSTAALQFNASYFKSIRAMRNSSKSKQMRTSLTCGHDEFHVNLIPLMNLFLIIILD